MSAKAVELATVASDATIGATPKTEEAFAAQHGRRIGGGFRQFADEGAELSRPHWSCTPWSYLQFGWASSTVHVAKKNGRLADEDLPKLWSWDEPHRQHAIAMDQVRICSTGNTGAFALLYRITVKAQPWSCLLIVAMVATLNASELTAPLLLQRLLQGLESHEAPSALLSYILVLCALNYAKVQAIEHGVFHSKRVSLNARSALMMAVFDCAISGAAHDTGGKLVNMISGDANHIGESLVLWMGVEFFARLLSVPYIVVQLYRLMGLAGLMALLLIWLICGVSLVQQTLLRRARRKILKHKDERSDLLQGLVKGVKLIRLHSCEAAWGARIERARLKEMRQIIVFRATNVTMGNITQLLALAIPLATFSWYTLVQGDLLSASVAFPALAWITLLRNAINVLPDVSMQIAQMMPGLKRIARAIAKSGVATEEAPPNATSSSRANDGQQAKEEGEQNELPPGTATAVELRHARLVTAPANGQSASAEAKAEEAAAKGKATKGKAEAESDDVPIRKLVFEDATISVRAGECLVIVGVSGCGKSTLLAALASARDIAGGTRHAAASRAYVSQKPFLTSRTLKDNILFELPYESERYRRATTLARLGPDIAALPKGDDTYVGESGVQLSGGQRARVAFARALYSDASVLCLDDVLSAVDSATGEALWQVMCEERERGKTIVLVTHQLQLLDRPEVSRVAFVREGRIECVEPWAKMQARIKGGELSELQALVEQAHSHAERREEQPPEDEGAEAEAKGSAPAAAAGVEEASQAADGLAPRSQPLVMDDGYVRLEDAARRTRALLDQLQGRKIDPLLVDKMMDSLTGVTRDGADEKAQGEITGRVIGFYAQHYGTRPIRAVLLVVSASAALAGVFETIFLSHWTEANSSCGELEALNSSSSVGFNASAGGESSSECDASRQRWSLAIFLLIGIGSSLLGIAEFVIGRIKCG